MQGLLWDLPAEGLVCPVGLEDRFRIDWGQLARDRQCVSANLVSGIFIRIQMVHAGSLQAVIVLLIKSGFAS